MKKFRIDEPCHENWAGMTPTEKGAFCKSCSKQVYDFTNKSDEEIKRTFREMTEKSICGRIETTQLESLNNEFSHIHIGSTYQMNRAMLFSLLVVFGLNLFSCSDEKGVKKIIEMQAQVEQVLQKNEIKEINSFEEEIENVSRNEFSVSQITDCEEPIKMGEMTINSEEIGCNKENEENHIAMGMMISPYIDLKVIDTIAYENAEFETTNESIPTKFESKIFPNPTSGTTKIEIQIPKSIFGELDLYDLSGRKLIEIHSGKIATGTFTKEFDMTFLPAGTYLVIIKSRNYNETLRIVKL
ncbi:MAG: T9SS type A sorting domain-containing protein [Flavobacteriia bacterium]|jgi:hypothetical protein